MNVKHMFLELNRKRKGFFLETVRDYWGVKLYRGEVNPILSISVSVVPVLLGHTIIKKGNKKLDHSVSFYVPLKKPLVLFLFMHWLSLSNFPSLSYNKSLQ